MFTFLLVSCSEKSVKAKEESAVVGDGYMLKPELCFGVVFGSFLLFGGSFIWSFASLELVLWVSEIMTDAEAVGTASVSVSTDEKPIVLAPFLVTPGRTEAELAKGCFLPAERLLAPSGALW